jgi:hypothetical protein
MTGARPLRFDAVREVCAQRGLSDIRARKVEPVFKKAVPMQNHLFSPALWMPAVGLIVAAALLLYGNARVKTPVRNAGAGLFALVLVWIGVAYFVQTPLEQCVARTRAIVAAVEEGKFDDLRTLLDENTSLEILQGREDIAAATEIAATSYGLKSITILSTEPIQGIGTVDVNFTALLEGAQATTSTWRFEYTVRPNEITLTRILPVTIGRFSADDIRRNIRGR